LIYEVKSITAKGRTEKNAKTVSCVRTEGVGVLAASAAHELPGDKKSKIKSTKKIPTREGRIFLPEGTTVGDVACMNNSLQRCLKFFVYYLRFLR
jgi:hypothetical protein